MIHSRYHARALHTPTEVRHALVYVLLNYKHHEKHARGIDVCSSGRCQSTRRLRTPDMVATHRLAPTGLIATTELPRS